MLLMTSVSITGHVIGIPVLLELGGRDAWLSVILAIPAGLLGLWATGRLAQRFARKTPVQYAQDLLGSVGGKLLGLIYLLALLMAAVVTVRNLSHFMVDAFMPATPTWAITIPYLIVVLFGAITGFNAIGRMNQLILLIVTVMGFFVAITSAQTKDYSQLLPVLANGLSPAIRGVLVTAGVFGEFLFLGFITPHMKSVPRYRIMVIALLYVAMTIIGPVTAAISQWGMPHAALHNYPSYEGWRMISLGRIIERVDLFAVHQWVAGAFPRMALLVIAAGEAGAVLVGRPVNRWFYTGVVVAILLGAHLLVPDVVTFHYVTTLIYYPAFAVLGLVLPVLLLLLSGLNQVRRRGQQGAASP